MSSPAAPPAVPQFLGHPAGLFVLFFAEMWERFSYYGMRALLVFYMIKGFLGYGDREAYSVYGAYGALVYMTPFFGGLIADRVLGARRAVVLGGLLMAIGHLTMTIENDTAFFAALGLLIVGNGFFKPNVTTIVGGLYPEGDHRRDGGFTIFYMGINLGAAMAPLLCGYVGETYGWHYGFGLATIGMLVGLAVFVVPTRVAQALILGGAVTTAISMVVLQDDLILFLVNAFVALALIVSGGIAFAALNKGGIPEHAGLVPPTAPATVFGIPTVPAVVGGTLLAVPILAWLVSSARTVRLIPAETIESLQGGSAFTQVLGNFANEIATPPGLVLFASGAIAMGFILSAAFRGTKVERERLFVVVLLMFFSMLFWAFFEQAGSSMNNFADRNVDRVREEATITSAEVGQTIELEPNQEQLGYANNGKMFTLTDLDGLRTAARDAKQDRAVVQWTVDPAHVGMGRGGSEIPASTFQSANPIFILLFGLLFTGLWGYLGARGLEPNTPVKFALGLLQLGLGFVVLWWAAGNADARGMVGATWLLLAYLLHTTGELCLSPVGLSAMTRLSPTRIASTVMGAWFLATSFSSLLAGIIATFTGVGHGGDENSVPPPIDTVGIYGSVFGQIGLAACLSGVLLLVLSPLIAKWMHEDAHAAPAARGGH
ncbi:MAG: peptide MFS transporter [Deltaproteobacteria bacterium]|nr:peptide MFS transporter [Deltaproteobacteria bacterium]